MKILPLAFLLIFFNSCATLHLTTTIPDEQVCLNKGANGAVCDWFFKDSQTNFTAAQWAVMSIGMACVSTNAIGDIKKSWEQLCSKTPCSYQDMQTANNFFSKFELMKSQVVYPTDSEFQDLGLEPSPTLP